MAFPHLPYAITEVYCAVFAATVWFRLNNNIGSEHEVRQLRNMIYSYIALLVTDVIWALQEDGIAHLPYLLNAFDNAISVMAVAGGCYFWFRFIEDRVHFSFASRKTLNSLLILPLLFLWTLDLISIFTGWLFYIDAEGHYQSTSLFYIHTIVNYCYLLVPTVYSIYRALTTHSRQERSEYWTYTLYMLAPLISGLLEDVFPLVPLLALNIFMVILILFLMIQNLQIYNDALTGLNNRRRLNQYLEDRLTRASSEHPVLLFMLDINRFKSINDVYGHLEGDHALKLLAGVLRITAQKYNAFIARYGGDEFCMVMDPAGRSPETIADDVYRNLLNVQTKDADHPPYLLTVSIGYSVFEHGEPASALAAADEQLYVNKKKWHASH